METAAYILVALVIGMAAVFGVPLFFILKRFLGWKRLWWS